MTHWKRLWSWEGLGAGGEGDDRGWDGWMALLTLFMWVWVNSGSWWWTGRPRVLRLMGSQRVRHDWATKLNWTELNWFICIQWVACFVNKSFEPEMKVKTLGIHLCIVTASLGLRWVSGSGLGLLLNDIARSRDKRQEWSWESKEKAEICSPLNICLTTFDHKGHLTVMTPSLFLYFKFHADSSFGHF